MSPHWNDVLSVFRVLAYLLKRSDDDGLDLHFTISKTKHNSKRSKDLLQKLKGKTLRGTSNIGSRLGSILHEYQMYLKQPASHWRTWIGKSKPKEKKALTVYVLTDAVWQPHSDPAEAVASMVTTLREEGYSRGQVGIEFIHFGNDPEGIEKLEMLDSGLGLPMYVVVREC